MDVGPVTVPAHHLLPLIVSVPARSLAWSLENQLADPDRPAVIVAEAGIDAALRGQADWCRGCDTLRYRGDMRWAYAAFLCRQCIPSGGSIPVWQGWTMETIRG